jgi:hypothetical protein
VVNNISNFTVMIKEALTQRQQRCFVGEIQGYVVELHGALVWNTRWLGEAINLMPLVLEERYSRSIPHVEKIVPERVVAYCRHQRCAEHSVPEPRGGIHIIGNEGEVI